MYVMTDFARNLRSPVAVAESMGFMNHILVPDHSRMSLKETRIVPGIEDGRISKVIRHVF